MTASPRESARTELAIPTTTTEPGLPRPGKAWRKHQWTKLEKVSRTQVLLLKRLEWLFPDVSSPGVTLERLATRFKELFEEDFRASVDYVHVVAPQALKRYMGDPTFLAVVAPHPHKARGFLEIELGLAHAVVDKLLGGAGETVALRALTDIEEGVMSYVLLEALKAVSPGLAPEIPRLRLEGMCSGVDAAVALLGDEPQVAVVTLNCALGTNRGYVRLFIPATVLGMVDRPSSAEARRQRFATLYAEHRERLSQVKLPMRVEVGWAEIQASDLTHLRERDVVLFERLLTRPDLGQEGTAELKVGRGQRRLMAQVFLEEGRYKARVTELLADPEPRELVPEAGPPAEAGAAQGAEGEAAEAGDSSGTSGERHSVTDSGVSSEGTEMLGDVPLQICVELARVQVTAEEVVSLRIGQVFDLNRVPGEPVDLSVNGGKLIARGELVEVDGHLGVRIVSLHGQ